MDSTFELDLIFPVIIIAIYILLALGLNIVVGFAGLLDLGFVAFYALGAYVVGLVRLHPIPAGELLLRVHCGLASPAGSCRGYTSPSG